MKVASTIGTQVKGLFDLFRAEPISQHLRLTELAWLLFLRMAKEVGLEKQLPEGYRWDDLAIRNGSDQFTFYRAMLKHIGTHAVGRVRDIYADSETSLSRPTTLRKLMVAIDELDWPAARIEDMGNLFEVLIEYAAAEDRTSSGPYITPRALVESLVAIVNPIAGEVVSDPAAGTLGFLTQASIYVKRAESRALSQSGQGRPPEATQTSYGVECSHETWRLALANMLLHGTETNVLLGDTLSHLGASLPASDVIFCSPPIGQAASISGRVDFTHPTKQLELAFLQHTYNNLKPGGRAAVVLPDGVLFRRGADEDVRAELMERCDLHTVLRLPSGAYHGTSIRSNVLFFTKGHKGSDGKTTTASKTSVVWFYDMRTNLPAFTKRSPITREHLVDFETAFGSDPNGKSPRVDQGPAGRFRCFTREQIRDRGDNLDIVWLTGNPSDLLTGTIQQEVTSTKFPTHTSAPSSSRWGRPAPDFAYTGQPEPGVCEWGEDGYGRGGRGWFIGFRVGEVVQRLRWIPPGKFWMGSPENDKQGLANERPQREVTLTQGYWLADTPVTQALWVAVMGENPSHFKDPKRPVEQVSWDGTQAFLQRLNALHPWLSAVLPTEAQWEHACRADTTTRYWSGDTEADLARVGWYDKNSEGRTHPVARLPPSPWGLHDMHGNAWEWCSLGAEASKSVSGKVGAIRGGSYHFSANEIGLAVRIGVLGAVPSQTLGFRIARGQPARPGPEGGGAEPRR